MDAEPRPLRVLSAVTIVGLGSVAVFDILSTVFTALGPTDAEVASGNGLAVAIGGGCVGLLFFAAFVATAVFWVLTIHRAATNVRAFGQGGLEFTPGWAAGWYFVPFANLVKPFQAFREIWRA